MPDELSGPAEEAVVVAALTRVVERQSAYSLVASDGSSERIFYFAIGGIRVIRSGPRKTASIGDVLVETGKLTPKDMGRAAAAATQQGRPFGETCVALKLVDMADVDEASRIKVREDLLDLFVWEEAEIRLEEGQPPKAFYEGRFEAARIGCDVPAFLQTVLARVDEWRAVLGRLPSGREVYETPSTRRMPHAEEWKNKLLALLDGTRTASDAITKSGARRVAAYEFLLKSLRSGAVKRVGGGASQRISRDQLAREIEALENALKATADAEVVRRRLARALEAVGEKQRAAGHWRIVGDRRRKLSDLDGALSCYRAAVAALPTDFATRELILEIHREKQDFAKLVADGRPLAELFVKHDLLNRAKHLLLSLVRIAGEDAALRRQLVLVLIGLSERDPALKHLRDLSRLLEKQNAPTAERKDAYLRILALDKTDGHARDRLEEITGAKFGKKIVRITVGAAAVVLVALGAWFTNEQAARRNVNAAVAQAQEKIEANDVAGAKRTLSETIDSFPHAHATSAAKSMLERIEAHETEERARAEELAAAAATPAQRAEAAAEQIVKRAKELTAAGRVDEAYRAFRELFDLYGATKAVESVSLPLKVSALPADARVVLAGEEVGRGQVVLRYSPRAKCTLVVERDGYVPFRRVLDGPQEASIDVSLERPTKWTYVSDAAIDAPPLVAGGVVYVAGRDRRLTALSAAGGAVQWRAPLGLYGDCATAPVMTAHGVFVATTRGDATCVDESTGEVLWRKDVGAGVERQPATVGGGTVVVPGDDGSLTGFGTAGAPMWTTGVGVAASPPVRIDDKSFGYVDEKGAFAFADAATGVSAPDGPPPAALRGAPTARDGRAWVMAEDQTLRVISTSTRRAVAHADVSAATEFPPTVAGETAYVATVDGGVSAFRASGEPVFRARIDEPPSAAPACSKGRVYVPGRKGRLYVLDAANGALLWRFDAKSRITSTPTIEGGTIYVTTAAGALIAVDE
jgi:outer membrane protein assembly factor BamB